MERRGLGTGGRGLGRVLGSAGLLLCSLRGFAGESPAAQSQAGLQITVRVYDFAGVSRYDLSTAEEEARRILRKARVETIWQQCPTQGNLEDRERVCREVLGPCGVYLRVVPASMAARLDSRRDDLGFALESARPGVVTDAWVFYHRIDEVATRSGARVSVILGIAMAHEIGHILLGLDSHSPIGIMRGGWHQPEFELAKQGQLVFTPKQSEHMRRELALRHQLGEEAKQHSAASRPATPSRGAN